MKGLLYFFVVFFCCKLSAQTFPVKKANNEYVVSNLKESEKYKNNIKEVIRDKRGLCWFQNLAEISSFDGVNWKSYGFTDANGKKIPVRINEIEVTDDSTIWLATPEGMFVFNQRKEKFVPLKQIFPGLTGMPVITNCIYKGIDNFLLVSIVNDGFYDLNWNTGKLKHVHLDSTNNVYILADGINLYVTVDRSGNYWGLTKENRGIWYYNPATGEVKCSWKGEIFPEAMQRLQGRRFNAITYSEKENALFLSYGPDGILEKINLLTGKSSFYTFSDELNIQADTSINKRYGLKDIRIDAKGNVWVLVAGTYLVKLNSDITKCEYLEYDPDLLPLGKVSNLLPETNMEGFDKESNNNLLWLVSDKGLSVLQKRNLLVKQIPFEKKSNGGITPDDYTGLDAAKDTSAFKNIFFTRDLSDGYLLLQQNLGRPKLIRFDKDLHVTNALFNNEWKKYQAYFNPAISSNDFYIAILRLGEEPLDFRNVVIKDFKVDLKTMKAEEMDLSFPHRVWRYGAADAMNVYWLFSNGYLYSYDPGKNQMDSIFICLPRAKKPYRRSRIKGFDYPTVLHKNSSTFWISFIADKELYKVDLKRKKIEKIFESNLEQKGALFSSVNQLYGFDTSRIYLKLNLSGALLNPFNDSVTIYSDLFKSKLKYEDYITSFVYKDWLCNVTNSEINFQNIVTGKQKRLSLYRDFTWPLSVLVYPAPVSDQNEMILMSSLYQGFVVFNLDSILPPILPGNVHFSFIKLNEKDLLLDSILNLSSWRLKYNSYTSIHFKFSDYSIIDQDRIKYEYTLYTGGDTVWNKIDGEPELTFTKITPGNYTLLVRATNGFGDYSSMVTAFGISIVPPFTQTPWFIVLIVVIVAAILYGIYRYRLQQVKRLQVIRNNIASDLHDDIGSTLNSISIYSEVAKQQAGKDIPALELIGSNSRKIIEGMSDIVWTINPENDSFEKIIIRMRSFAHQLLKAKKIEYTFDVDEKLNSVALPMQVRKNFYLVFKEAITNLIKYSGATRVSISLMEKNKVIFLTIRDNGKGIPINAETQGNGIMNMKRRADEIRASLNIISANGGGTGIELMLKT
jgi:hypothetical protein